MTTKRYIGDGAYATFDGYWEGGWWDKIQTAANECALSRKSDIDAAVAKERERCVKIIRDACFRGIGNRPEPTWQNIIESIENGDAP